MIFAWGMSNYRAILWLLILAISAASILSATSSAGQAGVNLRFLVTTNGLPRGSRPTALPRWCSSLKKRRANLGEFRRITGIYKLQRCLYRNMQYRQAFLPHSYSEIKEKQAELRFPLWTRGEGEMF